jgi:hypothetical protein
MIKLLLAVLCLITLTGLTYGLIFFLTWLTNLIIGINKIESFRHTKQFTKSILTISICISFGITRYYFFPIPPKNLKKEYKEKTRQLSSDDVRK